MNCPNCGELMEEEIEKVKCCGVKVVEFTCPSCNYKESKNRSA